MILLEVAPQTPRKSENKLKNEFVYSLKGAAIKPQLPDRLF
jgi:hypothetical protein